MINYKELFDDVFLNKAVMFNYDDVKNYCWKYNEAKEVIRMLYKNNYVILGGDVLIGENGEVRYTYSNWYYERTDNDNINKAIAESRDKAIEYIELFHSKFGNEYIYKMVATKQKTKLII